MPVLLGEQREGEQGPPLLGATGAAVGRGANYQKVGTVGQVGSRVARGHKVRSPLRGAVFTDTTRPHGPRGASLRTEPCARSCRKHILSFLTCTTQPCAQTLPASVGPGVGCVLSALHSQPSEVGVHTGGAPLDPEPSRLERPPRSSPPQLQHDQPPLCGLLLFILLGESKWPPQVTPELPLDPARVTCPSAVLTQ